MKKNEWDAIDVGVEHQGRVITLPADPGKMPLEKAVEALNRKIADENQPYMVHEIIDGYPLDAAVAFTKAVNKLHGFALHQTEIIQTMLGPKEKPPQMISVKTGKNDEDVVLCPLGQFRIPAIDEPMNTVIGPYGKNGQLVFVIHGNLKKKHKAVLLEIANEARRIVKEESIYRGKAIRLPVQFGDMDEPTVDMANPPEFMDVSDTSEADLLFDEDIQRQIETSILVPIKHTAVCKKNKIPLKRGILLEGPYGTGKSLTARMVANACEQKSTEKPNGQTELG